MEVAELDITVEFSYFNCLGVKLFITCDTFSSIRRQVNSIEMNWIESVIRACRKAVVV